MANLKKALGADITEYFLAWPLGDDWYLDSDASRQEIIGEKDQHLLKAGEKYDLTTFGEICRQGMNNPVPEFWPSFEDEVSKWVRDKTAITLIVHVNKDRAEEFRKLVDEFDGAKIVP
jgi:hypothetical protein